MKKLIKKVKYYFTNKDSIMPMKNDMMLVNNSIYLKLKNEILNK